ncbi:hypothetical protein GCM10010236_69350 [Streptomyces eurythermus]|nr:hypothetical protein GCM10010236_69350 [Streptomyces eurythermus]
MTTAFRSPARRASELRVGGIGNAALNTVVMCADLRKRSAGQRAGRPAADTSPAGGPPPHERLPATAGAGPAPVDPVPPPTERPGVRPPGALIARCPGCPGLLHGFVGGAPDP